MLAHPHSSHSPGGGGYTLDELKRHAEHLSGARPLYLGDPAKPYSYSGIEVVNCESWADDWWNMLLDQGYRVWDFGTDDCDDVRAPGKFSRAWIAVNSALPEPALADILGNIRAGNFHMVVRAPHANAGQSFGPDGVGPRLEVRVSGNVLSVRTDPGNGISFITAPGGRETQPQAPASGELSFRLPDTLRWARVKVTANAGGDLMWALSQPVFNLSLVRADVRCRPLEQRWNDARNKVERLRHTMTEHTPVDEQEIEELRQMLAKARADEKAASEALKRLMHIAGRGRWALEQKEGSW